MPGPVWSVTDKVAWNYLIIADVHLKGSTFELYRYNNSQPTHGLPMVERLSSTTFIGLEVVLKTGPDGEAFRSPTEDTYLENIADHLIQFADRGVPAIQKSRTPIYFYGTGNANTMDLIQGHKLMPTMCSLIKGKSDYLIADCDKQFRTVDEDYEGIFSWVAANYQHKSHGNEAPLNAQLDTLLLGNSASTTVYMNSEKAKSGTGYALSLPLGNGDAEIYNLHVQTNEEYGMGAAWDKYLQSGKTSCFFSGSKQKPGNERGDFKKCKKEIATYLRNVPSLPSNNEWSGSGEIPILHKLAPSDSSAETLCASSWGQLDKKQYPVTDLTRLCFKSAYYRALLDASFSKAPDFSYQTRRWTEGRALLHAADELNPGNKHPAGIQHMESSYTWEFNADVSRPNLGLPVKSASGGSFLSMFFPIVMLCSLGYLIYINRQKYLYKFMPGQNTKKYDGDRYELPSSSGRSY